LLRRSLPGLHPTAAALAFLTLALLILASAPPAAHAAGTPPPAADRNLGFLVPVDFLPEGQVQVLTTDGRVLRGQAPKGSSNSLGIRRFTLIQPDGTRLRLRAKEVLRVTGPADADVRAAMIESSVITIEKASNTDWRQIEDVNELVFDSIAWPDPDDRVLLLRLNPGFDRNFRVYALTKSRESVISFGGVRAFGGEIKAHIVVKGDQPPIKVKKGNYRQLFETLYGDCPTLLAAYPKKDREFSDFANHVAQYDRECGAQVTDAEQRASR
jgi:hypothetical protein